MTTIAVLDYGSGNLHSAKKAFERAACESGFAATIELVADAEALRAFDFIVLPGVGAFPDCRAGLERLPGMLEALKEAVIARGRPFFGICVGMQILFERGIEHGLRTAGFRVGRHVLFRQIKLRFLRTSKALTALA